MCAAMLHRGPDDTGMATRHEATIGGCRLAIFDPANGRQPMVSPDRRWTLVFNGAIYNFQDLRGELGAQGWEFHTACDTEVLLAAFAQWGAACLARLRGMYAFAVWDDQERSLFIARDPFGIKPLYFQQQGQQLVFASEINALLASGMVAAEIDARGVADYLAWLAVPAPRTIYRGVFSLRPGEFATFKAGELKIESSWGFRRIPDAKPCGTYEEFVAELRTRLDDTIRAHVLADVPVGAFLSGGLDSAAVVGLMTRATGVALRTFSIGFNEPEYSEVAAAEATARHFGARHQTHILTGAEVAGDVDTLLATLDQPTGDGINTFYASRTARRGGVTVALSGLGGDELFGGYPSFRDTPRLARWLGSWRSVPRPMRRLVVAQLRRGDTRRRKLADVLEHATDVHQVGSLQRRVFSEMTRHSLLSGDAKAVLHNSTPFHPELAPLTADLSDAGVFELVSAWELRTYMTDVLLRDSDVMSMRHSLELRVPFVDRVLIEWLWRQPAAWKSNPARPKQVLADAVADLLPPGIAGRRKHGFTLPFAQWMKAELRPFLEETFSTPSVARSGLFAPRAVQNAWIGFVAGNDTREWSRIWSLAILVAFANRRACPSPTFNSPIAISASGTRPRSDLAGKRALLLAPEIYSSEGGIPRILQIYLKALCDCVGPIGGVRLVGLNDPQLDSVQISQRIAGNVEITRACGRRKFKFLRDAVELARGCDFIVCGHIRQLPIAWLAQRFKPSLRYYLVAHGIEVWRQFTAIEKQALRGAERILCISEFTRGELLKHCLLPPGRAVVLHNALDPNFAIEPGRSLADCPPTILVVTRLTYADRYKGVQHLIEAMPTIRQAIPTAKLKIIGRGDDLPRLQQIRESLHMGEAIEFLGYVDDSRLTAEMRACRLFALPSRKEGFGLVFLEAMASGRPCLGARAGGIPEVITSDTGILVEYGDIASIAAGAVEGLQQNWDENRILARARKFSFPLFKERLEMELSR
jgi:asparagine synthase (glutamine-hydrolysing)